ncbi:MAG TPA: hypothetical protein VNX69_15490 [Steroidobacteraceae bacterium]|jgi:hypothetical protein|nr:hypothetical protein [Steroidobacteraceae bacterium]
MIQLPAKGFVAFAICYCVLGVAHATDPLPAEARLVAASGAATTTQQSFTIAAAQDLVVTFTDLQIPAALVSASVVVTQGAAIAGTAQLAAPATSATVSLPAATGDYTLYVFGQPNAGFSVGTFTVCVAPKASPSNCIQSASLAGNITAQSTANDPTVSTFNSSLQVTTAGSYTFNFQDLQFPVALNTAPNLALFQGSTAVKLGITAGSAISLSPGAYTLLAIAQADQTVKSGLYGITIALPGSPALLDTSVPVGLTKNSPPFLNATAQSVTLKVVDYGFPGPLASASALLTAGGSALGQASAAGGAMSFQAPAGDLQLWTYAAAGATPGTFSADVSGAADLYTIAQGVQPAGSAYAYAFVSPPLTAGSYQATATDLQFPSQLSGLSFAVAQNGAIVQQSATAAPINFNATAGNAILLVGAQTPASGSASGNGLFDVNLQTSGASAQLVYDKTQSVSSTAALLDTQTLNLGTSASFDASLTDLKFPAAFSNLALVVSRGSQILGKIYGGGVFSFPGSPGSYQLTFVATPGANQATPPVIQQFGLYGVSIVFSAPVVNLTSSVASAVTDTAITLTWSSSNASSCTASGGNWTGSKAAGGGTEVIILSATTTYTLSCTGTGGVKAQSVTVTATAKPSSSGGGGGALDMMFLMLGGTLAAARLASNGRRALAAR